MVDAFGSTNKVSTDNAETIQLWYSSLFETEESVSVVFVRDMDP